MTAAGPGRWRGGIGAQLAASRLTDSPASSKSTDRRIAVFNVAGQFHAIDDTCTHRPASLSEDGELDDGVLVCGWHGSMFDLATGKNVGPPACDSLRTYDLEISESIVGGRAALRVPRARAVRRRHGPPVASSIPGRLKWPLRTALRRADVMARACFAPW